MEASETPVGDAVEILKEVADESNANWAAMKIEKEETGEVLVIGWARRMIDVPRGV